MTQPQCVLFGSWGGIIVASLFWLFVLYKNNKSWQGLYDQQISCTDRLREAITAEDTRVMLHAKELEQKLERSQSIHESNRRFIQAIIQDRPERALGLNRSDYMIEAQAYICRLIEDADRSRQALQFVLHNNDRIAGTCTLPPAGWACKRHAGHEGPCAAFEVQDARERVDQTDMRRDEGPGSADQGDSGR